MAEPHAGGGARHLLRVGIFLHERMADENPGTQSMLTQLQLSLEKAGRTCFLSSRCQAGLGHDPRRVLLPAEFVPGGSIGPVGKK